MSGMWSIEPALRPTSFPYPPYVRRTRVKQPRRNEAKMIVVLSLLCSRYTLASYAEIATTLKNNIADPLQQYGFSAHMVGRAWAAVHQKNPRWYNYVRELPHDDSMLGAMQIITQGRLDAVKIDERIPSFHGYVNTLQQLLTEGQNYTARQNQTNSQNHGQHQMNSQKYSQHQMNSQNHGQHQINSQNRIQELFNVNWPCAENFGRNLDKDLNENLNENLNANLDPNLDRNLKGNLVGHRDGNMTETFAGTVEENHNGSLTAFLDGTYNQQVGQEEAQDTSTALDFDGDNDLDISLGDSLEMWLNFENEREQRERESASGKLDTTPDPTNLVYNNMAFDFE